MLQKIALPALFLVAFILANLPFITRKRFVFWGGGAGHKSFAFRLLEWLVFYLLLGALAIMLEGQLGQVHVQGWVFYVTTLALFATCAFPGFTFCYLYRPRQARDSSMG